MRPDGTFRDACVAGQPALAVRGSASSAGRPAMSPLSDAGMRRAAAEIALWQGYSPTPLQDMSGLAARLGVRQVGIKLEGHRFEVGSFKALGPPYALRKELDRIAGEDLSGWTAVAATSGNHGRALAWGAGRAGIGCRIFVPRHVSAGRMDAIRRLGGEVVPVAADFDGAAEAAADAASKPRHLLIGDRPGEDCQPSAIDTLFGYSVLGHELLAQTTAARPTHVFIAAGNGSLAAALVARLRSADLSPPPVICTVEPHTSCAIHHSLRQGRITSVPTGESVMDGLVVRTPSALAWSILRGGLDAALAIDDRAAVAALRDAWLGRWGDPPLAVGETGIASLAGLIAAASDSGMSAMLGIGPESRLVAIACEGVTDPDVFAALVAQAQAEEGI